MIQNKLSFFLIFLISLHGVLITIKKIMIWGDFGLVVASLFGKVRPPPYNFSSFCCNRGVFVYVDMRQFLCVTRFKFIIIIII